MNEKQYIFNMYSIYCNKLDKLPTKEGLEDFSYGYYLGVNKNFVK